MSSFDDFRPEKQTVYYTFLEASEDLLLVLSDRRVTGSEIETTDMEGLFEDINDTTLDSQLSFNLKDTEIKGIAQIAISDGAQIEVLPSKPDYNKKKAYNAVMFAMDGYWHEPSADILWRLN